VTCRLHHHRMPALLSIIAGILLLFAQPAKAADENSEGLILHIEMSEQDARQKNNSAVQLSGGWMRVQTYKNQTHKNILSNHHQQKLSLRTTSGKISRIEIGEVRRERAGVRRYLARYGIIQESDDVEYTEITAGFDVTAILLAENTVHLKIRPWFARDADSPDFQGAMEMLPALGSTASTTRPPSTSAPIRLNMQPEANDKKQVIYVHEAQTELNISIGESVTLAAVQKAAHEFSSAITAASGLHRERNFLIRLQIIRTN